VFQFAVHRMFSLWFFVAVNFDVGEFERQGCEILYMRKSATLEVHVTDPRDYDFDDFSFLC
jgi:hypothetical protein